MDAVVPQALRQEPPRCMNTDVLWCWRARRVSPWRCRFFLCVQEEIAEIRPPRWTDRREFVDDD